MARLHALHHLARQTAESDSKHPKSKRLQSSGRLRAPAELSLSDAPQIFLVE
jgi:hypothetical protein